MKFNPKPLDQDDLGLLLAVIAILFGVWARITPPLLAGMPVNDGGFFYVVLNTLQENRYELPATIPYNGLEIPFAYPPLAFYFTAFLSDILNISILDLVRWLPATVSSLVIPALYSLALQMFSSRYKAGLTVLLYAFTSKAITWMVMGGGLTRSLGQLFLVLALRQVHELYTKGTGKSLSLTILFSSLVVLTHPEAAVHTLLACVLMFLFINHSIRGFVRSIFVAIATLLFTSIWWLPLLARHGIAPFTSAAQTGHFSTYWFFPLISFDMIGDPFFQLTSALAFLGLLVCLAKREYFFPVWLAAMFFFESRNAPNVAVIILNLCGAVALADLVLPGLMRLDAHTSDNSGHNPARSRIAIILGCVMLVNLIINISFYDHLLARNHPTQGTLAAFNWAEENLPLKSKFLILSGETNLFCDTSIEWFPALTGHSNLTTVQGQEWLKGDEFADFTDQLIHIQSCIHENASCLLTAEKDYQLVYDYLFILRYAPTQKCTPRDTSPFGDGLIHSLNAYEPEFILIYDSPDGVIYSRIQKSLNIKSIRPAASLQR